MTAASLLSIAAAYIGAGLLAVAAVRYAYRRGWLDEQ